MSLLLPSNPGRHAPRDYLLNLEKDQTFKGGAFKASGHTYAKQKFETKEEFDEAAKKKKGFFGRG
jgi:hypothetical protein